VAARAAVQVRGCRGWGCWVVVCSRGGVGLWGWGSFAYVVVVVVRREGARTSINANLPSPTTVAVLSRLQSSPLASNDPPSHPHPHHFHTPPHTPNYPHTPAAPHPPTPPHSSPHHTPRELARTNPRLLVDAARVVEIQEQLDEHCRRTKAGFGAPWGMVLGGGRSGCCEYVLRQRKSVEAQSA